MNNRNKSPLMRATQSVQILPMAAALRAISDLDAATLMHCCRVSVLTGCIASELRLGLDRHDSLVLAGLLHDAGKLFLNAEILNKPGRLTREEYDVVKQHPAIGAGFLRSVGLPADGDLVYGALCHHERYDGLGYPEGLKGHAIPLAGLVVGVADSFDAMTSVRCYGFPRSLEEAAEELRRQSGLHFDPDVSEALLRVLRSEDLSSRRGRGASPEFGNWWPTIGGQTISASPRASHANIEL